MKITGFKDTIDWYDDNADLYATSANKAIPFKAIAYFLDFLPKNPRILEAGCAGGRESKVFVEKNIDVVGVDISEGLLKVAKEVNPTVRYIQADFRDLPFKDREFDAVWSHASLVHMETIEDMKKSLKEFHRVLKSSGYLYVYVKLQQGEEKTAIVSDVLSNHERFFRYYTQEEIASLLSDTGFDVLDSHLCDDLHGRPEVKWIEVMARKTN